MRAGHAPPPKPQTTFDGATADSVSELLHIAVQDQREDWRGACIRVQRAFEHWARVPRELRAEAFAAYCLALEEEERSSAIYRSLLEEIGVRGRA